jgi:hypothetical protein
VPPEQPPPPSCRRQVEQHHHHQKKRKETIFKIVFLVVINRVPKNPQNGHQSFLNRTVIIRSTPICREYEKTDTTSRLSVVKSSRSGSFDFETESFGFRPDSVQV